MHQKIKLKVFSLSYNYFFVGRLVSLCPTPFFQNTPPPPMAPLTKITFTEVLISVFFQKSEKLSNFLQFQNQSICLFKRLSIRHKKVVRMTRYIRTQTFYGLAINLFTALMKHLKCNKGRQTESWGADRFHGLERQELRREGMN